MTTSKDKSVEALIAGCRKGDRHDWAELIDRLAPVIFSACYRIRLSREESYDVFGKVSLLLLENLDKVRHDERIYGYVSTIAHHEAKAMKSRSRRLDLKLRHWDAISNAGAGQDFYKSRLESEEELDMMSRAFEALSHKCRELLRLLFFETADVSYRDISRQLGIPISSIGPTRGRCLEKLRQNMIKEGYEE